MKIANVPTERPADTLLDEILRAPLDRIPKDRVSLVIDKVVHIERPAPVVEVAAFSSFI